MMKAYREMNREELLSLKEELDKQFADAKGKGLKLDMSRGKPGLEQLDMIPANHTAGACRRKKTL